MSPKRNPLAKATILVKRKNGMSFEDFDKHWSQTHGPLLSSLPIFREKIVKYSQTHVDVPNMLDKGATQWFTIHNDFDGVMHAYAEKWEDFMAVFASDDYKNLIIPDEEKFIQREECKLFFTYEEVHWDRDDPSFASSS